MQKKANPAKAGPTIALEVADLRQLGSESLTELRVGDTKDTYMQACVKAKKIESVKYLKTIGSFPIAY